MARSWSRNTSLSSRQKRIARHPRNGFISGGICKCERNFVAAKIERSDDHRVGFHGGDDRTVGLKLLFLARRGVAIHEKILGPKEAHAFGSIRDGCVGVTGLLDVRRQAHARAIEGHRGFPNHLAQTILDADAPLHQLSVLEQSLIGRVHHQKAVEPVSNT